MVAFLAIVSREPGQALTGAAISGVALCEGRHPRTTASLNTRLRFLIAAHVRFLPIARVDLVLPMAVMLWSPVDTALADSMNWSDRSTSEGR